ncbi:hypothetical protein [Sinorhizobium fredii]|uniref:hypothetical protein n=1 Tax=Rhizobium fredii TaxID=380 RepID=UPI000A95548D|nr:hypothetical protein [Sinorhizobium fredii]
MLFDEFHWGLVRISVMRIAGGEFVAALRRAYSTIRSCWQIFDEPRGYALQPLTATIQSKPGAVQSADPKACRNAPAESLPGQRVEIAVSEETSRNF